MSGPLLAVRRVLDSLADSHISTAATDISGHGGVVIAVGRVGGGGKQRRRGHDLAGLAIGALRDLEIEPRLVNLSARGGGADGLDRGDALAGRGRYRPAAPANRRPGAA